IQEINAMLRKTPREAQLSGNIWDGKTLAAWIEKQYGISLSVRQCQRMFRQFGFRLRKPRPAIAQANPELQRLHKKTPGPGGRQFSRPLGHRRSAFSTARFPLSNVGSTGNQRSCFAA